MGMTSRRIGFATLVSTTTLGGAIALVERGIDPDLLLFGAVLAVVPWLILLLSQEDDSGGSHASSTHAIPAPAQRDDASAALPRPREDIVSCQSGIPVTDSPSSLPPSRKPAPDQLPLVFELSATKRAQSSAPVRFEARNELPAQPSTEDDKKSSLVPQTRASTKTASNRRRPLPVLPAAGHYMRHTGVPGELYLARNPFHAEGIFKLGYTTLSAPERVQRLTEQCTRQAKCAGHFDLIHHVQVSASYDMEQMLFDALGPRRIDHRKEFFYGTAGELRAALDAAAAADREQDSKHLAALWSAGILEDRLTTLEASQGDDAEQRVADDAEFIGIFRNRFHRRDVYKLVAGASERQAVAALDKLQATLTSQLGKFVCMHRRPARHARATRQYLARVNPMLLIAPGLDLYEAGAPLLIERLDEALSHCTELENAPRRSRPIMQREPLDELDCITVHGASAASWEAWTTICRCGARLRVLAAIGAKGDITCPRCKSTRACRQGAERLVALAPWKDPVAVSPSPPAPFSE